MAVFVLLSGACTPALSKGQGTPTASPFLIHRSIADLVEGAPRRTEVVSLPAGPPTNVPTPAAMPVPQTSQAERAVVQPDQLIHLRLGERIEVAGTGWTLRFAQVLEDSRCPTDAQCIWAGRVVVRLLGEHQDGRVAALTLTLGPGGESTGLIGDLPIEAGAIEPLRSVGSPPATDYTLRLRVTLSA